MVLGTTTTAQVINPQVMADTVSAKLPKLIKFTPLAVVETTLVGRPGDELTVPQWTYSGDATEITEGQAIPVDQLGTKETKMKIKQAGKAIEITDKAALVGHGNVYGEATNQIALAIANKVDNDIVEVAKTATQNITEAPTTVANIDKALEIFADEEDARYVALINPRMLSNCVLTLVKIGLKVQRLELMLSFLAHSVKYLACKSSALRKLKKEKASSLKSHHFKQTQTTMLNMERSLST